MVSTFQLLTIIQKDFLLIGYLIANVKLKDRITHMSTSSNKQQEKGKDGMGKAGKRKEMVKDWCEVHKWLQMKQISQSQQDNDV